MIKNQSTAETNSGWPWKMFWMTVFFLFLGFSSAQAQYNIGDIVIYGPGYLNANPDGYTDSQTTFVTAIPPDLTFISCSGGQSCTLESGQVVWTLGDLPLGASGNVTLVMKVTDCFSNTFVLNSTMYYTVPSGPGTSFGSYITLTVNCVTDTPTISPTPTITPTVTLTPTPTVTNTITNTPTITLTPTITPTFTPVCNIHVWPDPFNPKWAVGGYLKVNCVPTGATASFFTLSGELVQVVQGNNGVALWDGRNRYGNLVASGVYYYLIQVNGVTKGSGKFLVDLGS